MNYAAMLAVLAVLAFAFPVLVRLAERGGVREAWAIGAAVAGAALALAAALVRERVHRHREASARIERIRAQLEARPDDPAAFLVDGAHLGDLLASEGRPHEAIEVFERHLALVRNDGREAPGLERRLLSLRSSAG